MGVIKVPDEYKWYNLILEEPDGQILEIEFPDVGNYEKLGSPYVDHVPNPRHVCVWAGLNNHTIDIRSLEMLVGRWELEVGHNYDSIQELLL